jgi:hypothetical protein
MKLCGKFNKINELDSLFSKKDIYFKKDPNFQEED